MYYLIIWKWHTGKITAEIFKTTKSRNEYYSNHFAKHYDIHSGIPTGKKETLTPTELTDRIKEFEVPQFH